VHLGQLRLQGPFGTGGIGVDAGNAWRPTVGPNHPF